MYALPIVSLLLVWFRVVPFPPLRSESQVRQRSLTPRNEPLEINPAHKNDTIKIRVRSRGVAV